jgi:transcriptional regulator with XRE-family HTH domain
MRTLAERLKAVRKEKVPDMSQQDLADLSGVSQTTIANIESGRNQGSKHLLALAAALGVRAQWLADETGLKTDAEQASGQVAPVQMKGESVPAGLKEVSSAYLSGSEAKQEALRRLAKLPEQEMGTLLLVIQSIGSKYKK